MRHRDIMPAWGRILLGYRPFLSIEITKECPLRCPGCYAYEPEHLNNGRSIRSLFEWRGDELVSRIMALVRQCRPIHVSIVGGEPLLRQRELTCLIPQLGKLGIEVQVVTSAVRPIPKDWAAFPNLHLVVSVDGLASEHDARRAPATYERILRNISGNQVILHCTIVPRHLQAPEYLKECVHAWSLQPSIRKIWFSLFTPQRGMQISERLSSEERKKAIDCIADLRRLYPKLYAPGIVLSGYRHPPNCPLECIFAQVTTCVTADLETQVTPCQIGGRPECRECGCIASAGFASLGKFKIGGLIETSTIFRASQRFGEQYRKWRLLRKPWSDGPGRRQKVC